MDLLCSAHEEAEMRQHLSACAPCARHDMLVRRGLMLVKSLPTIEPSPDFQARLEARLRVTRFETPRARSLRISYVTFASLAAAIGFVALLGLYATRHAPRGPIRLAPVVASMPAIESSPLAATALVAAAPTGMSVWPAIMAASEAPVEFVAAELTTER
ncbi:MAG TPA: hypothetical protein VJ867_05260 [Gemmatimonadaceae bacterium]|nr:hypothetical protein [Gemmatimonadaceae bacterium]